MTTKESTVEGGLTLVSALFEVQKVMPWLYIALNDKRTTENKNEALFACIYYLSLKNDAALSIKLKKIVERQLAFSMAFLRTCHTILRYLMTNLKKVCVSC